MAYCSLVVETMGKHKDWKKHPKYASRCRAYEAEVAACMDEMERIKPGINAQAEAHRMALPAAPRERPPPVVTNASANANADAEMAARVARLRVGPERGDASPASREAEPSGNPGTASFAEGDWDLLSASPAALERAAANGAHSGGVGVLTPGGMLGPRPGEGDWEARAGGAGAEASAPRFRPNAAFVAAPASVAGGRRGTASWGRGRRERGKERRG